MLETQPRWNPLPFLLFVISTLEAIGILPASVDITAMLLLQRLVIDLAAIAKPATSREATRFSPRLATSSSL